jgi:hypothetical protein
MANQQVGSREEVETNLDLVIRGMMNSSYDFSDLMRRIIPDFRITLVRNLDGFVRPRGVLTVSLAALAERAPRTRENEPRDGDFTAVIDLFDPPTYIRHMAACLAEKARDPKLSLKKIGARLGIHLMIVKRAFDYARQMREAGWETPYQEVKERPTSAPRWKPRPNSRAG